MKKHRMRKQMIELTDANIIEPNYCAVFINGNSGLAMPIRFVSDKNLKDISIEIIQDTSNRKATRFFDGVSDIVYIPDISGPIMVRVMPVATWNKEQRDQQYAMAQAQARGRH